MLLDFKGRIGVGSGTKLLDVPWVINLKDNDVDLSLDSVMVQVDKATSLTLQITAITPENKRIGILDHNFTEADTGEKLVFNKYFLGAKNGADLELQLISSDKTASATMMIEARAL